MAEIIITPEEVGQPEVEEAVARERALARPPGVPVEDVPTPWYYNPVFYYSLVTALGGFLAWVMVEPFISDGEHGGNALVGNYLAFAPVAVVIGMSLGFTYGLVNRNFTQMLYCSLVGLGMGMGVTLATSLLAGMLFGFSASMAGVLQMSWYGPPAPGAFPMKGVPFLVLMGGRGLAWSLISLGAGVSLGMFIYAAAVDYNEIDEWGPIYLAMGAVYTGVGALVGWAIDSAHSKPHVRFNAPSVQTMRIRVAPLLARRKGMALVLSF